MGRPPLCPGPDQSMETTVKSVGLCRALPLPLALIFHPGFKGNTRPWSVKFSEVSTLKIQREHLLLLRVKSMDPVSESPVLHCWLFCVKTQQHQ